MMLCVNQSTLSALQHSALCSAASTSSGSVPRLRHRKDELSSGPQRPHLATRVRSFSSTPNCRTEAQGHYNTLGVPHSASKAQIKSSYYKLSKQYHPDVNQEQGAKERFHAVSEAYDVLGDDRKRRAYDRAMAQRTGVSTRAYAHGHDHPSSHWSYDVRRRRGATHAWEHHYSHRPPPGPGEHTRPPPGRHYERPQEPDPFASPHVRRATGHNRAAGAEARAEMRAREEDMAHHESVFWRVVQVMGVVLVVAAVGGGVSAST
ncbi:hypothetical protein FOMPIDRAFT_1061770 [Fomitopsis schrenkii]|uniref:J domain-containing protein n=1 Tax=Fomitopsis schrenkii TaxID=2126942 RepID=S8F757_FOMSC|nr:hypothetical protein FOMPIDRAFT_1061770 [Fomitopsis schrenkii]